MSETKFHTHTEPKAKLYIVFRQQPRTEGSRPNGAIEIPSPQNVVIYGDTRSSSSGSSSSSSSSSSLSSISKILGHSCSIEHCFVPYGP
jgi:hypothetical protein